MKSVYSAVRTGSLNKAVCSSALEGQKGKAIPLQAWTGPEGSRRLRLLVFKTIGA